MKTLNTFFYSNGTKISVILNIPDNINIENNKLPFVILCHGYGSYKDEFGAFVKLSQMFCSYNFATFRFDFRGCGESTNINPKGKMLCATEWPIDILNAVNYVKNISFADVQNINLLGISMGGTSVLHSLRFLEKIKSVIVISSVLKGYDWIKNLYIKEKTFKIWEKFYDNLLKEKVNIIEKNIDNYINMTTFIPFPSKDIETWNNISSVFPQATTVCSYSSICEIMFLLDSSRELKTNSKIPILFIHGISDTFVNYFDTKKMYNLYKGPKDILLLDNKPHSFILDPDFEDAFNIIINWVRNS